MLNKIIPTLNGTGPTPVPASTTTTAPNARKRRGPRPTRGAAKAVADMIRIRQANKLSQSQVADLLDVHFTCVSKWETRGSLPRAHTLNKLREFNAAYADRAPSEAPKEEPKSQQHILTRDGELPLRFKGVKLGSYLLPDGLLTIYQTDGGQVVWDLAGIVNFGSADELVQYWAGSKEQDKVLAFAAECGLEIFEDIA